MFFGGILITLIRSSKERTLVLDIGTKINYISEVCALQLELVINPYAMMIMVTSTEYTKAFIRICEDVKVKIKNTVIYAHLYNASSGRMLSVKRFTNLWIFMD